jgi:DNA-binding IclR family transcriptional regulator
MEDEELDHLFTALGERGGLPTPTDAEVVAALDLARVVARGLVRRGAPLACYAAGLAMGAAMDPAEREARLRALVAEAEALVEEGGGEPGSGRVGHG